MNDKSNEITFVDSQTTGTKSMAQLLMDKRLLQELSKKMTKEDLEKGEARAKELVNSEAAH